MAVSRQGARDRKAPKSSLLASFFKANWRLPSACAALGSQGRVILEGEGRTRPITYQENKNFPAMTNGSFCRPSGFSMAQDLPIEETGQSPGSRGDPDSRILSDIQ